MDTDRPFLENTMLRRIDHECLSCARAKFAGISCDYIVQLVSGKAETRMMQSRCKWVA